MTNIICADVLDWAAGYEGPQFHAMLCDPPYELSFMGKHWDASGIAFQPETWAELAEHLLPGAFVMAFGGSRTYHRLACALEDAGLVIHPAIVWVYGSGFPKATRLDKKLDEAAGQKREVSGRYIPPNGKVWNLKQADNPDIEAAPGTFTASGRRTLDITAPATPLAATWAGHRYGLQALKPAAEFICVAQKPYAGKPVDSIVETGAGALNIDAARVGTDTSRGDRYNGKSPKGGTGYGGYAQMEEWIASTGRWPANFLLSHLPGCRKVGTRRVKGIQKAAGCVGFGQEREDNYEKGIGREYGPDETIDAWSCEEGCPVQALGEMSGKLKSGAHNGELDIPKKNSVYGKFNKANINRFDANQGTAARFFYQATWEYEIAERLAGAEPFYYCAKASRRERDAGLDGFSVQKVPKLEGGPDRRNGTARQPTEWRPPDVHNPHPTVKPIALTRYLATLLLPPPAYAPRRILCPFAGVGSEMIGAGLAGWEEVTGIEREAEYVEIGEARLRHWLANLQLEMALQ